MEKGKKKTLNKQEIYGCCLPMKTQWEESSACNVDGCRLENKAWTDCLPPIVNREQLAPVRMSHCS